jgi:hypothetical protein
MAGRRIGRHAALDVTLGHLTSHGRVINDPQQRVQNTMPTVAIDMFWREWPKRRQVKRRRKELNRVNNRRNRSARCKE